MGLLCRRSPIFFMPKQEAPTTQLPYFSAPPTHKAEGTERLFDENATPHVETCVFYYWVKKIKTIHQLKQLLGTDVLFVILKTTKVFQMNLGS